MVSCREAIEQLWDYLDGELTPERAEVLAAHLAQCGRCYPQYRFELAFLDALARQRDRFSAPPRPLVERLRSLIAT